MREWSHQYTHRKNENGAQFSTFCVKNKALCH